MLGQGFHVSREVLVQAGGSEAVHGGASGQAEEKGPQTASVGD